jgi:hypothetical protein
MYFYSKNQGQKNRNNQNIGFCLFAVVGIKLRAWCLWIQALCLLSECSTTWAIAKSFHLPGLASNCYPLYLLSSWDHKHVPTHQPKFGDKILLTFTLASPNHYSPEALERMIGGRKVTKET